VWYFTLAWRYEVAEDAIAGTFGTGSYFFGSTTQISWVTVLVGSATPVINLLALQVAFGASVRHRSKTSLV